MIVRSPRGGRIVPARRGGQSRGESASGPAGATVRLARFSRADRDVRRDTPAEETTGDGRRSRSARQVDRTARPVVVAVCPWQARYRLPVSGDHPGLPCVALGGVAAAAAPPYLAKMPTPAQVEAKIHGSDAIDT